MGKRVKVLTTALLTVVLVFAITVGASATTGTKSLSAIFRNIQMIANGKVVQAEAEPFIVGGRTYVPLRAISEALGAYVDWNAATNIVTIKGGTSSTEVATLKAQIAAKDAEIASLKAKLNDQTSNDGDLGKLEDNLIDDYDNLGDVEIDDIRLTGDEDDVTVKIDVDLGDFDTEWDDLSDSDIEDWLDDLCADIQDYYSDDTYIDGEIQDIDSDDNLVDFNKDGNDDISVDFNDDDYRGGASAADVSDVEDALDGDSYSVGGIDFEITNIDYDTDSDEIDVELTTYDVGAEADWNGLSNSQIENDVEDICMEIADAFEEDANADAEIVNIDFYSDDDNADLESFEYDVIDRDFN